jgi:hypothetical protein
LYQFFFFSIDYSTMLSVVRWYCLNDGMIIECGADGGNLKPVLLKNMSDYISYRSRLALGLHQPPMQQTAGALSQGDKTART